MSEKKQARVPTGKAEADGAPSEIANRVYYVVNPGGAIHACSREIAAECFQRPGWRKATPEEMVELERRKGHQTADNPICKPWSTEPDQEADGGNIDANTH